MPIKDQEMYVFLRNPPWNRFVEKSKPLLEKVNYHPSFFCIAMHVLNLHNFM
jgi:hypothetical protein